MELSLPGTFAPGSESSIGGTFAPGSESSMELSLPGANIQWNFRSMERNYPGTFAPKMGKTTTYTHLQADDSSCRWTELPIKK